MPATKLKKAFWLVPVAAIAGLVLWGIAKLGEINRTDNVLLITLDTTRADRLGCYGYAGANTPALDAFAAQGLKFKQAFTHVPFTLPSHATMLTGLYPPEHRLRDNESGGLPSHITTLPGLFREHGYDTAAFISSFVLDKRFGLSRGFDVYDDRMDRQQAHHGSGPQVRADIVADRAVAWLRKNTNQPFFCWIHFFDPHFPYDPPAAHSASGLDPYDGEIAFMDANLRRILNFLDARGLNRNTLVSVVGDHEPLTASGCSKVEIRIRANLAAALMELGELEEAAVHCRSVLEYEPNHPDQWPGRQQAGRHYLLS